MIIFNLLVTKYKIFLLPLLIVKVELIVPIFSVSHS